MKKLTLLNVFDRTRPIIKNKAGSCSFCGDHYDIVPAVTESIFLWVDYKDGKMDKESAHKEVEKARPGWAWDENG